MPWPLATTDGAALKVTAWPATGATGLTAICACKPSAAITAAPASSIPAPQAAVVQ